MRHETSTAKPTPRSTKHALIQQLVSQNLPGLGSASAVPCVACMPCSAGV